MTLNTRFFCSAATVLLLSGATCGAGYADHHVEPPPAADTRQTAPLHPLVLQADFAGLVMTGVAYSVEPRLRVHNLRPLIPLYDIGAASRSLAYNAQSWPSGSVFVSVVDPGVGTARKSVVLKTRNGLFFVSPDNGSLSDAAAAFGIEAVREIDESVNRIPGSNWSHTFHGRDVYSYTGARLAAGVIDFEGVGPLLPPEVIQLPRPVARRDGEILRGTVAGGVDRLGNAYFSIDRTLFEGLEPTYGETFEVTVREGERVVWEGALPYVRSFGGVAVGEPLLFLNSSGQLAVAINQGSFAATHGIGAGPEWQVTVRRTAAEAPAGEPAPTPVPEPAAGAEAEPGEPSPVPIAVASDEAATAPPLASAAIRPDASAPPEVVSRQHWIPSRDTYIPATLAYPAGAREPLPLVLLLHGHGGTRHEAGGFTQLAQALARRGIASMRMDFPGCGESIEPFRRNNLTNMLSDARAAQSFAMTQLDIDPERQGLVGFSMGGRVALHMTSEHKGLKALALWAPSATDGAAHLMDYVGGPQRWTSMHAQAAAQGYAPFTTFWGQRQQLGPRWFSDLEASRPGPIIERFNEALLVVYGSEDPVIPPAAARAVVEQAASARRAALHEVTGANHGFGLFDDRPELTRQTVRVSADFLAAELTSIDPDTAPERDNLAADAPTRYQEPPL